MVMDEAGRSQNVQLAVEVLSLLSKKWHLDVIATLERRGPLGFNDLLQAIPGVSGKVLTDTLESLTDAGVVDRTVVRESPLRVEYDLTAAGSETKPIFESLTTWGERHLESAVPTILIADSDRRLTDMYAGWLSDRYAVTRAHNGDELESSLRETPDVLVLERDLPGVTSEAVFDTVPRVCRTILLVGDRPGFDVLDGHCDDVLQKPIVRGVALDAIDQQLSRRGEPPEQRERAAIDAAKSLLESIYSRERLEANAAYVQARTRLQEREPNPD